MADYRMQSPVGPVVVINGKECHYFSGTGYLGLQNHPQVMAAAAQCLQHYGLSTATSRGGYGEHPLYDQLEQEIRGYFGREGVVTFPSGYQGMSILLQGLTLKYDRIFIDEQSHYSILDAARLSGKSVNIFRHLDPEHLKQQIALTIHGDEIPLVLSDGVFPISGEICPLPDYLKIVEPYQGLVFLDDAHGIGVLGDKGRGTLDHFGLKDGDCLSSFTMSKALGAFGGMICEDIAITRQLAQGSRVLEGSSPIPLPLAAAATQSLRIARTQPAIRERLWENVKRLRGGLRKLGWQLEESKVPIICLSTLPGMYLAEVQKELFNRNICVAHVRSYTSTPIGGALRIAVFASHTNEQIDLLVATLKKVI